VKKRKKEKKNNSDFSLAQSHPCSRLPHQRGNPVLSLLDNHLLLPEGAEGDECGEEIGCVPSWINELVHTSSIFPKSSALKPCDKI